MSERLLGYPAHLSPVKGALLHPVQARDNLEASFVAEAEMVFTTLSGTGRRILEGRDVRFETVLVDEAAQASELATLQAFAFGCRRWGRLY